MFRSKALQIIFLLALGIIVGYTVRSSIQPKNLIERIQGNSEYPFINQSLDTEAAQETTQGQIVTLKSSLMNYIQEETARGNILKASVYYRDLNNGPWMGINEKEEFSPASLLKVPIMMAIYKLGDDDKSFLEKKIVDQVSSNGIVQDIKPEKQIIKGETYVVDDLVYRMIVYSDNDAKNLLFSKIDPHDMDQIYNDLGISVPGITKPEDFMSVKTYASFFRVLFNGSYLSRNLSNRALFILSQSEYDDGLVAGLPKNIKISHKFGERFLPNGIKQLHDCGVVYAKDSPYILCVMTRGNYWDKLSNVIKNISKETYKVVSE